MPRQLASSTEIAKATERLLAAAAVGGRLPTPIEDIVAAAKLVEPAESIPADSPGEAAQKVIARLIEAGKGPIEAVACRVVHGGERFDGPAVVTDAVLEEIRALGELAPLHNPMDAAVIDAARRALPDSLVAAVFDTAFHRAMPAVASTYALPWELSERRGLRRYGFHGISHRFVSGRLVESLGRPAEGSRLITCHLGNGASVCAIKDGRSVDTSMGLTPTEGLVMGTRSGDLDPGLVLHLIRTLGMTADEVDDLLNHRSGLLGISGRSADVRDLERAAAEGDARCDLALDVFAYRVSKYIGAYFVALEGADAIAFTGGIGEHSASMRARICRPLACLGVKLDEARYSAASGQTARISADDSPVQAWVIPTDEELQMARETSDLLSRPA